MARIRSIHPDACDSRKLAAVSSDAERLFWRLITHCDDHGRCEDDPRLIWARCGPLVPGWDQAKVDALLESLARNGLLVRYVADGLRVLEVHKWGTYQHPQRRGATKYASPPVPVTYTSSTRPELVASGGEGRGVGEATGYSPPLHESVDKSSDPDGTVPTLLDETRAQLRGAS